MAWLLATDLLAVAVPALRRAILFPRGCCRLPRRLQLGAAVALRMPVCLQTGRTSRSINAPTQVRATAQHCHATSVAAALSKMLLVMPRVAEAA